MQTTPYPPKHLSRLIDDTWPAQRFERIGPITLRLTKGAGSRVCAATIDALLDTAQIEQARKAMIASRQSPLFKVRGGEVLLDQNLEALGYVKKDPTIYMEAPIEDIPTDIMPGFSFANWPLLSVQKDIWQSGGIGAERLSVMQRVTQPKTCLLVRDGETPAGAAFVACSEKTAVLHAVEVLNGHRRKACGTMLLKAAAQWAGTQGALRLGLFVTRENMPAIQCYTSLKLTVVGEYHYRAAPN